MSYLVLFDLLEDLRRPGCPVCRAAERTGREYARTLMMTDITDARVRESITRAGGLCRDHLFLSVDVAAAEVDTMGLALLEELLLDIAHRLLVKRSRRGRRHRVGIGPGGTRCTACEAEKVTVDAYCDLLISDPEVYLGPMAARDDGGLCFPHARWLLDRPGGPACSGLVVAAWARRAARLRQGAEATIAAHRADARELPSSEQVCSLRSEVPAWLVGARRQGPT